ncbi:MAG: hypothetical protein HKN89_10440 [Eudoraea sp.]|nr:hypothetical protein [Eudoraea sp.]
MDSFSIAAQRKMFKNREGFTRKSAMALTLDSFSIAAQRKMVQNGGLHKEIRIASQ